NRSAHSHHLNPAAGSGKGHRPHGIGTSPVVNGVNRGNQNAGAFQHILNSFHDSFSKTHSSVTSVFLLPPEGITPPGVNQAQHQDTNKEKHFNNSEPSERLHQ